MSSTNTIRLVTRSGPIRFNILDVNTSNTTIASFKEMIASVVGIPAENQCILRKSVNYKEMHDEQTMHECGIIDDVHLFVWPSTDPVVMRVRACTVRQEKYNKIQEKEREAIITREEINIRTREEINMRIREEERLTQVWFQEYETEAKKAREAEVYWAEWRKKHNLFDPISKK